MGAASWRAAVYSHSLLQAMGLIFLLSWRRMLSPAGWHNEQRMRDLLDPVDLSGYLLTGEFWNRTL